MFAWSDVHFAVVVVCQQKQQQQLQQQRQLQQQEWRPWGKRGVENKYVIDIISAQKGTRLCVLKRAPGCVSGDHPRDVIPGLAGVIVLET